VRILLGFLLPLVGLSQTADLAAYLKADWKSPEEHVDIYRKAWELNRSLPTGALRDPETYYAVGYENFTLDMYTDGYITHALRDG
jgi:hypothetical protein